MKEDEEGFRYPVVDTEKCIDCHLCEKVCPILHPVDEIENEQKGFIVQHRNNEILRESTSGGRTFNDFLNMAKNLDTDKIQNGISSLQKAISLFGDLIVKKDDSIPNTYTPRPLYKTFED